MGGFFSTVRSLGKLTANSALNRAWFCDPQHRQPIALTGTLRRPITDISDIRISPGTRAGGNPRRLAGEQRLRWRICPKWDTYVSVPNETVSMTSSRERPEQEAPAINRAKSY